MIKLYLGESLTVCRLNSPMQSEVLAFVSNFKPLAKTFYFSRVGLLLNFNIFLFVLI